ncbi:hypothetical protein CBM2592_A280136 [Cupriavidus taiwanensis]|nr:hypothetical protein CBM2592_A280136 [Cupriavidus taiwanensis]SOY85797.1 hypothetical protein CBM2591_A320136 [Cupriavidus taiwanensis]SPA15667.1 hypothetical protein CBM2631_A330003 [Cupriavidus taiwanensis]SPD44906.1 protein of unknown function [Cupriavidus taiwanensis]
METTMKIALYARFGTQHQGAQGMSMKTKLQPAENGPRKSQASLANAQCDDGRKSAATSMQ